VVDAHNFKRVEKGKVGLLRLYDLTNRAMAFAVQTDKMGFDTDDGFEIVGKWDRCIGASDLALSPQHPGGRSATKIIDFLMRRKLSKLGDLCSRLED
jgi:hypothetical protein